jgi:hypothetical protein
MKEIERVEKQNGGSNCWEKTRRKKKKLLVN